MTPPQFLVDALPTGDRLLLDGPEGRHAATVRRLRTGELLLVGDGAGAVAECRVDGRDRDTLALVVDRRWTVPAPSPRVVVAQALVKGDRGELAVELATEAGADAVLPWFAERCVVRWDDPSRAAKSLARWRNTAREAAKQARRAWVPTVGEPVDTAALAAVVRAAGGALVLDPDADIALADAALPARGDLILVVGPEGGIAPGEVAALAAAGAVGVRLGDSVLRASTAATVALGALGVLTQRWR